MRMLQSISAVHRLTTSSSLFLMNHQLKKRNRRNQYGSQVGVKIFKKKLKLKKMHKIATTRVFRMQKLQNGQSQ